MKLSDDEYKLALDAGSTYQVVRDPSPKYHVVESAIDYSYGVSCHVVIESFFTRDEAEEYIRIFGKSSYFIYTTYR